MQLFSDIKQFFRDRVGATAVEFAIVSVPFFILFLGVIEFGLFMVTKVALESAVTQAGRSNAITLQTGQSKVDAIKQKVADKTSALLNANEIIFAENTIAKGGTLAPDICYEHGINNPPAAPPGPPTCNCATCQYIDGNGKPGYQQGTLDNDGGNSGELVELRVSYPWHVLFPILGDYLGNNGVILMSSSIVVRNE